jgi:O-antigen ligase
MYFVSPDTARLKEWHGGELIVGNRLSGLTATPNSMGLAASFGLMLSFYYLIIYKKNFILIAFLSSFSLIALIMSNSRTSIIALVITIIITYFLKFTQKRIVFACISLFLVTLVVINIDTDEFFSMISRSGDAEEITTGTGRSFIWKKTIELIEQKPFTGWGYASTSFILPQYEYEIGHAPSTAHNLALQTIFSIGIPGFIIFVLLFLIKLFYAIKFNDTLIVALLVFTFITGLTEPSVFRGVASMGTMVFAMALGMNMKSRNL